MLQFEILDLCGALIYLRLTGADLASRLISENEMRKLGTLLLVMAESPTYELSLMMAVLCLTIWRQFSANLRIF